jgi:hypothetical protein
MIRLGAALQRGLARLSGPQTSVRIVVPCLTTVNREGGRRNAETAPRGESLAPAEPSLQLFYTGYRDRYGLKHVPAGGVPRPGRAKRQNPQR